MTYIRYLHVLAAAAWIGEVIVINFVLIPFVSSLSAETKKIVIQKLFPRIFRLASVLAATTAVCGYVYLFYIAKGNFSFLFNSQRGIFLFIGALLGTLLTLFHFFMENKMAHKIGISDEKEEMIDDIHLRLKIVPRVGLLVITTIFICMMISVRGL